jgi:two-component system, OmpR family, sensor histidine kinase TctE
VDSPAPPPEQRSLLAEILDWMLTPLLLLWPVSMVLTWVVAQDVAGRPFDRALEYNVGALTQLVGYQQGRVTFNLPLPARELLRADDVDTVYYQVLGLRGELLSGERDLPLPPETDVPSTDSVRLRNDHLRGTDIKVAYTWARPNPASERLVLVQVAETLDKRSVLATEIIKGVMIPQFVILPLAILLVWLALEQAVRPLARLERRIRARRPDDLSPLDIHEVPLEMVPVATSMNDLLARLKESMVSQKRFLADAAHQLKTPLAGLRMQAELALREGSNTDELKQSLRQIGRSSIRATHTVNQLLALARAESSGASMGQQNCDLARLTQEVVQECVPHALDRRLDLGYEGPAPGDPGVSLPGHPTLLKEMVRNLVDNAIHYTPSPPERPGVVTVRVLPHASGQLLQVQVEDNGRGIPEAERDRVMQAFYRGLGEQADGSGLGLSIVHEIARQHQASVQIDDTHPGDALPGARFTISFAHNRRRSAGRASDAP